MNEPIDTIVKKRKLHIDAKVLRAYLGIPEHIDIPYVSNEILSKSTDTIIISWEEETPIPPETVKNPYTEDI